MQAREVADVEAYGFFVCFEMCLRGTGASSSFIPASCQVLPGNTYIKYKRFFLLLQLMLEQSLVIRKDVAHDVDVSLPPLLYPHPPISGVYSAGSRRSKDRKYLSYQQYCSTCKSYHNTFDVSTPSKDIVARRVFVNQNRN